MMSKMRVMVVDDNLVHLHTMQVLLRDNGIEVDAASSPEEALGKLENPPYPHCMVIDQLMPSMLGTQLIRTIRMNPHRANINMIMLTSLMPSEEDMTPMMAVEDCIVLHKPFDVNKLLTILRGIDADW